MTLTRSVLLLSAMSALAACAPQSKYAWGSYEPALYAYYKTPGAAAAFAEQLNQSIATAEESGARVPPGMYAEYGYMLLEQGKGKEAVAFFEKERSAWPESARFMNRMLQSAQTLDQRDKGAASHVSAAVGDASAQGGKGQ
ncbi:DUF4810 domain-containing protein [Cupriavidus sp. AU9028]|uniref:DUF4810 domain-containing protein n=1 Tax=Cupriavidus sp. AU9028 TaxID=2871157 RepID=UPI001C973617|nr:DUF4810 domain-containing protein [Cupriavidus sp. AU9028]MBY4899162.1 DUF4810 domain-containing protein [Cupriavidus sp. AU9028]